MPRSVPRRIKAMRAYRPPVPGLCAYWTWRALGGDAAPDLLDYCAPLGAASATVVAQKTRDAGKLHTGGVPQDAPRGAVMLWTGGSRGHGHMAMSLGWVNGTHRTLSTDAGRRPSWRRTGGWVADVPTSWISGNWRSLRWAGWSTWYGVDLPLPYPGRPIRPGDTLPHIREVKRRLGVDSTSPTYGRAAVDRVKAFQRRRPWLWPADGVIGPRTYAAILRKN